MISFLQSNLGGGIAAQSLVLQTAVEQNVDILVLSKFYKYRKSHEKWHCDSSNRSAVVLLSILPVDDIGAGNDRFVWVTIGDVRIYSCY